MKEYIEERVKEVANYTINKHTDIRTTAKVFGVSKTTVHKDLLQRLKEIDPILQDTVMVILKENKVIGQLKGGQSTARLYAGKKELNC